MFERYDLMSMPVVDHAGTLVGRITVDDVMDVIEIDPAVVSGPFITISNDILGVFIYLQLATLLMKIFV